MDRPKLPRSVRKFVRGREPPSSGVSENRSGVRTIELRILSPADAIRLLSISGASGSLDELTEIADWSEGHPLWLGLLADLLRRSGNNVGRWRQLVESDDAMADLPARLQLDQPELARFAALFEGTFTSDALLAVFPNATGGPRFEERPRRPRYPRAEARRRAWHVVSNAPGPAHGASPAILRARPRRRSGRQPSPVRAGATRSTKVAGERDEAQALRAAVHYGTDAGQSGQAFEIYKFQLQAGEIMSSYRFGNFAADLVLIEGLMGDFPELRADRALYLEALGRLEDARAVLEDALRTMRVSPGRLIDQRVGLDLLGAVVRQEWQNASCWIWVGTSAAPVDTVRAAGGLGECRWRDP